MLRINRQADDNGLTVLALEGRLTADLVAVVDDAVAAAGPLSSQTPLDQPAATAGPPPGGLVLDLNDLSYVDQAGVAALRRLLDRGLGIARCPNWIRLLLAQPPDPG